MTDRRRCQTRRPFGFGAAWVILLGTIVIVGGPLIGCSDEKTVSTLPDTHPSAWIDGNSPDFHGRVVSAGSAEGCKKCHGQNLNGGLVAVSCLDCHLSTGACTTCHGGLDNATGAPPYGLRDEVDNITLAVGAHTTHVAGTPTAAAVACDACHVVPALATDSGHVDSDSLAEITWGALAGPNAVWSRTDSTCSDTYCHGDFRGGNTGNAPQWTISGQVICGTCHDYGAHPALLRDRHEKHVVDENIKCYQCHSTTVDAGLNVIGRSVHVDGENTVSFSSGQGTYANGQCTDVGCHGREDW